MTSDRLSRRGRETGVVELMQLSLLEIVILACVQGATEFLPVSSSGHLVIMAAFLAPDGRTEGLDIPALNIVLHGGTLLSILVFYARRILKLLGEDRRTLGLLIIGTIPAVVVGLPLKKFAGESILANPLLAGCLLPLTGILLLGLRRPVTTVQRYQELTVGQVLWIGISQAAAILPGLSRSGVTISTATRLGLAPESAATFSFLLAIPAIGGACVLELAGGLLSEGASIPLLNLAIGAGVAFVVGLVCLNWLVRWVERGLLHYFAWWCIPVGIGVVIWQLFLVPQASAAL
jgi:undecaprenyl-diphosphatase